MLAEPAPNDHARVGVAATGKKTVPWRKDFFSST
jgi:hypothetical protein